MYLPDFEAPLTQGTLETPDGLVLPLESTRVEARLRGPMADVTVEQVFTNRGTEPVEANYRFPLPHEGSVYALVFRIGDRTIQGVVKEKEEARRRFARARAEGRAHPRELSSRPALRPRCHV